MVAFSSLLLAGTAVAGVLGAPRLDLGQKLSKRASFTPSSEGLGGDGFFYSIWSNEVDEMNFSNGAAGEYSLTWSGDGDVVCGKGWQTGSDRTINYSGTYQPDGGSFLSVYGWFTNPLTEYYILEDYGVDYPGDGITFIGNHTSDGSVYSMYRTERINAASIEGTTDFQQIWSIRQETRVGGTITTANHYKAWRSAGIDIDGFHYQILATEGYKGSGSSNIKVAEIGGNSNTAPSSSAAPSPPAASSSTSAAVSSIATPPSSSESSTAVAATSVESPAPPAPPASSYTSLATSSAISHETSSTAAPPSSSSAVSDAAPSMAFSSAVPFNPPSVNHPKASASSTATSLELAPSLPSASAAVPVSSGPISSASVATPTEVAVPTTTDVTVTVVTVTVTVTGTAGAATSSAHAFHRHHHFFSRISVSESSSVSC